MDDVELSILVTTLRDRLRHHIRIDKMRRKPFMSSRREFVKKAAYVPPAILTLKAVPAFAKQGSEKDEEKELKGLEKEEKK